MKRIVQTLIFISAAIFALGIARAVDASQAKGSIVPEIFNGVKINISAWYMYHTGGKLSQSPISVPNKSEIRCAHQVRNQIFNRAMNNAALRRALYSRNFMVQIELNSATEANNDEDGLEFANDVVPSADHLYVRVQFHELGLGYGHEDKCKLPVSFSDIYPFEKQTRKPAAKGRIAFE